MNEFSDESLQASRTVTNREVARWLARGNGECCNRQNDNELGWPGITYTYKPMHEDKPVRNNLLIRKWCDNKWVVPTREYMGID